MSIIIVFKNVFAIVGNLSFIIIVQWMIEKVRIRYKFFICSFRLCFTELRLFIRKNLVIERLL